VSKFAGAQGLAPLLVREGFWLVEMVALLAVKITQGQIQTAWGTLIQKPDRLPSILPFRAISFLPIINSRRNRSMPD
jgi:hypothetical protein